MKRDKKKYEENGDLTVAVVESGQIMANDGGGAEESILPYEITRYPVYSTINDGFSSTMQALTTPSPAKNRVLLLRRKTVGDVKSFSGPLSVVPFLTTVTPTSVGILRSSSSNKRKAPTVARNFDTSEPKELTPPIPDESWHKCSMCDKKYKCRSSLDSHIKIHQGEIAKCEYCGQTMSRTRDLKRHIATVHRALLQAKQQDDDDDDQQSCSSLQLLASPGLPDPLLPD